MRRRTLTALAVALGLAGTGTVLAVTDAERKAQIDSELSDASGDVSRARAREAARVEQVEAAHNRVKEVAARLAPLETRLANLEGELRDLRTQLTRLESRLLIERKRLEEGPGRPARPPGRPRSALARSLRLARAGPGARAPRVGIAERCAGRSTSSWS